MRFRPGFPVLALLLATAAPWSASPVLAEGGSNPEDRFFPKEMTDAVAAMKGADPEDSFNDGLAVLARMQMKQGAMEPMRKEAFPPVLEHGLSTRLEYVSSYAGEVIASLDAARACKELSMIAEKESDEHRLYNAVAMLETIPWPGEGQAAGWDPVEPLVHIASKGSFQVRVRAAEALGEAARPERGCPAKARDKAVTTLIAAYGSAGGKESDLKNVCAVALGKIGSPKAIPSLLSGMGMTEGKHCFFAAQALSLIEDPSVFATIAGAVAPTGEPGEAFCKALEGSAREVNVPALAAMVAGSGKDEVREAAAVALARLLPAMPAPDAEGKPAGVTPAEKERSGIRAKAASVLFEGMLNGRTPAEQWACFHALSRGGGPWLGEPAVKLLWSPNPGTQIRAIHLAGDWKLKPAAKILSGAVFSVKDDLVRRRCAIEFWRIGDREAIEDFKKKLKESSGGVPFARGCDTLGSWRCKEAYDFAIDLLRLSRENSAEQFAVELCLEKMTGHFFGPTAGIWNRWFEKNPNFFTSKQAKIEREKWREEFDKENKGFRQTKETEKAVQMGLEYLARHQDQEGSWDPSRFRERCDRSPPCSVSTGARVQEDPVSRTALSILAFTGAGYSPEGGKYRCTIRRGLEYMMARQQASGDYLTNDLIGGYDRPVSLQAYAEACAVTHDKRYLPFVQRGVDFLTQIQNSIGGWRYRVIVETSDSSVASWMLFSMKAAEKAGAQVREIVYEGTRLLFDRYSVRPSQNGPREDFVDIDPTYGFEVGKDSTYEFRTGYEDKAQATNHATTAVGLMAHILMGFRRSHPFCIGSANYILAHQLPAIPKDGNVERIQFNQQYPMYFLYYGTLSMHQMGGRYFKRWNEQVRVILPALQIKEGCGRGSWKTQSEDGYFGALYTAAMGVLAMETYYRYLPVLQD